MIHLKCHNVNKVKCQGPNPQVSQRYNMETRAGFKFAEKLYAGVLPLATCFLLPTRRRRRVLNDGSIWPIVPSYTIRVGLRYIEFPVMRCIYTQYKRKNITFLQLRCNFAALRTNYSGCAEYLFLSASFINLYSVQTYNKQYTCWDIYSLMARFDFRIDSIPCTVLRISCVLYVCNQTINLSSFIHVH